MLRLSKSDLFELGNKVLNKDIFVREVTSDDELQLLAIRNDPENYKWFFSNALVPLDEHKEWFKERLMHAKFFTLVAEVDNDVIGIAYLSDFSLASPKISISVKPGMKGLGVGTKLLQELIVRSRTASINSILAEIMSSNIASMKLFSCNGFVEVSLDSRKFDETQTGGVTLSLNLND